MKVGSSQIAWKQYTEWQKMNNNIIKKINSLIQDIQRNGLAESIGKPEHLKYHAVWSRRIDKEHRLVYSGDEREITIYSCKGHYPDKNWYKDQTAEYSAEEKRPLEDVFREAKEIQAEKNIIRESLTDKSAGDKNKDDDFLLQHICFQNKGTFHQRLSFREAKFN